VKGLPVFHGLLFLMALALPVLAQSDPPLPAVIERYEEMLRRSPGSEVAFDRIYDHYQQGSGNEALQQRWESRAETDAEAAAIWQLLAARVAERAGRQEEAAVWIDRAAEQAGENAQILGAVADFRLGTGDLSGALDAMDAALKLKLPVLERLTLERKRARTLARDLQDEAAAEAWIELANRETADDLLVEEAAEALLEMGRYEEAAAQFERLLELAGRNPFKQVQAIMRLAIVSERQNETEAALTHYESALPLVSNTSWMHREVRTRIEDLYRRRDDLPGLIQYYTEWLETNPRDIAVLQRLSEVQFELGNAKEALAALRKAAELAPESREIQVQLASRLRETTQFDEAARILARITAEAPEELAIWLLLGDVRWEQYQTTRDGDARTAALEAWSHLAPAATEDAEAILALADLLAERGAVEEAETEFRRAIEVAPTQLEPRQRLARFLLEDDRASEAWPLFDPLLDQENPPVELFTALGRLRDTYDSPEAALAAIERGLEQYPEQFDLLQIRLRHLETLERHDEAIALAHTMIELAPNRHARDDIERRLLFFLRAADLAESTTADLREKLEAETLSVEEQRLLVRLAIDLRDVALARDAIAHEKAGLPAGDRIRLELEVEEAFGTPASRIALLREWIELEPANAAGAWRAIVRIHQESGDSAAALEAAGSLLQTAPADPNSHLVFADAALLDGEPDRAVEQLEKAVIYSDQPQAIWRRIARIEADRNEPEAAITAMEQAFAAEETVNGKLGIVADLAELYTNAGRLEELLADYRERQSAEGGWRYSLYLAAIHASLQNYPEARQELAKVITRRPDDRDLIRQALALAEKENNSDEIVRWQERLFELDPSAANLLALAQAHLQMRKVDAAVELLSQHQDQLVQDPALLSDAVETLLIAGEQEAASSFLSRLDDSIERDRAEQLELVRIAILAKDATATEELWQLWRSAMRDSRRPDPAASQPPPSTSLAAQSNRSWWNFASSSRYQRLVIAAQQFWQRNVFAIQQIENARRGATNSANRSISRLTTSQLPSDIALEEATQALGLLKLQAVISASETVLITRLNEELDRIGATPVERLLAWTVLGYPPLVTQSIADTLANESASVDALTLAMGTSLQLLSSNELTGDQLEALLANALASIDRLIEARPQERSLLLEAKLQIFRRLNDTERIAEVSRQILDSLDRQDPMNLVQGINLAIQIEAYNEALALYEALRNLPAGLASLRPLRFQPEWIAMTLGSHLAALDDPEKKARGIELLVDAIAYDQGNGSARPRTSLFGNSKPNYQRLQRFGYLDIPISLPQAEAAMVQNLVANPGFRLAKKEVLEQARATLDPDQPDPELLAKLAALRWRADEREAAAELLEEARAALASGDKSPHWNAYTLDLALQQLDLNQPGKALEYLETLRPRSQEERMATGFLQLRALDASPAPDKEAIAEVLEALKPLYLDRSDYQQLSQLARKHDLEELQEAFESQANPQQTAHLSPSQINRNQLQILSTAIQTSQEDQAIQLALNVTAPNPFPRQDHNWRYNRNQALSRLKNAGLLAKYIETLEFHSSNTGAPGELWRLHEAHDIADDDEKSLTYLEAFLATQPVIPEERASDFLQVLIDAELTDTAIAFVEERLQQSPDQINRLHSQALQLYVKADRVPDFIDLVIDLPLSESSNPRLQRVNQSTTRNYGYLFQNLAAQLLDLEDPDTGDYQKQAFRLLRHAIHLPRPMRNHDHRVHLMAARLAVEEEDRDLLLETIKTLFYPEYHEETMSSPLTLNQRRGHYQPGAQLTQVSNRPNGVFDVPALSILASAQELDLLDEVRSLHEENTPRMQALATNGENFPDFLGKLLRIVDGDRTAVEELRTWIQQEPREDATMHAHLHVNDPYIPVWVFTAASLSPELREEALAMALDLQGDLLEIPQRGHWMLYRGPAGFAMHAENHDQIELRDQAIQQLLSLDERSNIQSANPNFHDYTTLLNLTQQLLARSAVDQAAAIFELVRNTPNVYRSNHWGQIARRLEIALEAQQKPETTFPPEIAPYYRADAEGNPILAYQIQPQLPPHPHDRNRHGAASAWSPRAFPSGEGKWTVELWGGAPDDARLIESIADSPVDGQIAPLPADSPLFQFRISGEQEGRHIASSTWLPAVSGPAIQADWEMESVKRQATRNWQQPVDPAEAIFEMQTIPPGQAPDEATRFIIPGPRNAQFRIESKPLKLEPGRHYLLTFWVRQPAENDNPNLRFQIEGHSEDGSEQTFRDRLQSQLQARIAGDWTLVTQVLAAGEEPPPNLAPTEVPASTDFITIVVEGRSDACDLSRIRCFPLP